MYAATSSSDLLKTVLIKTKLKEISTGQTLMATKQPEMAEF